MDCHEPHPAPNEKRNPSSGQNGQLVHWWLLIHSGPAGHERDPVLSGQARSSVCDEPELRHGQTDKVLYI